MVVVRRVAAGLRHGSVLRSALKHQFNRCAHRVLQHLSIATTAPASWYMDGTYELEPVLPMRLHSEME